MTEPSTETRPKLLFFVVVDHFFCSHFLDRALAAQRAGYDVTVLARETQFRPRIEASGIRLIHVDIDRRSLNPFVALLTVLQIFKVFRAVKPELIHQVGLKPILLGGLAYHFLKGPKLVNAVVGGGALFISQRFLLRMLRKTVEIAFPFLMNPKGSKVVFENRDDLAQFVGEGYVRPHDAVLIRGAGVDPDHYQQAVTSASPPLVLMSARVLWDKGVGEYVEAARLLLKEGVKARFAVVGGLDPGNRATVEAHILETWKSEGSVEFWGFRTDMPAVLAQASIACLPSYREGLPKALLEAMASGLPCVTTDVPGCREAVRDGDNGLIVPARDARALANALKTLILDPDLRARMGARGLQRVHQEFSSEFINRQTLDMYMDMGLKPVPAKHAKS